MERPEWAGADAQAHTGEGQPDLITWCQGKDEGTNILCPPSFWTTPLT